ncbi:Protein of unknown function DUF2164 [Paenibacillus curdlanolyticus YK9]|uniref:DUF2164 domain-containing protein n=1 Tax=Paenibacillus curdlanolyticus YK9 TaxID=717606 RepID=E0I329_9BACL|nr:DUF2164 domain-containing protein [Paenibacillus curdlanolyticus]EFM12693.1 Protein of unknown function DUF2164 [Paenibacillus curdlanolyticus YK9]
MIVIKLPKEEKAEVIKQVQAFFEEERSESIGEIAAELLVDRMIQELGPYIYNRAIADTRAMVSDKFNQIDDELYALEKPASRR